MLRNFVLLVLGIVLLTALALGISSSLDVFTVYNPREVSPWHVFFVWVVALFALWVAAPIMTPFLLLALASVTGGASSNLLYRLIFGPVPDYIPFPFGAYGNVADLCIFFGVPVYMTIVAWHLWKERRRVLLGRSF